jgi:TorA maturation chaperone TorD
VSEIEAITAVERERTYRFLANLCLNPPSDSLIAMIKDRSILSVFQDDGGSGEAASYPPGLLEFVGQAEGISNLKDELEAEHTALFVLPFGVLPHEAVYLDKEKKLGGRVTISVREFYEKAAADIHENCIEMPDHLGMQLDFMGFLCKIERESWERSEMESLQKCVELQKAFLGEHLLKWVYQCCETIIEKATYGFYKAAARFMAGFIKSEEKYVAELYARVCSKRGDMRNSYLHMIVMIITAIAIAVSGMNTSGWAEEEKSKAQIKNEVCLACHSYILDWKTKRKDIAQPHRRHLESKNVAYGGKQKLCVTCHEAWVPADPGWMGSGVYHPDTAMKPDGVWKKYIQRKDTHGNPPYLEAVHPEDPYTFKPLLKRLVCRECHGPDSKIKVLYGLSER